MRESRQFRESLKKQQLKIPDKDINYFIYQIDPKPNKPEDYNKVLTKWNQYSAARKIQKKQANNILSANSKRASNTIGSNLCQICYEQISRKRAWCRICGQECCEKCMARARVVDNDPNPVLFCEKCDKDYMVAMIVKEEEEMFALRQKSFVRLAQEQQMIESLLKMQRQKLTGSELQGSHKNELLQMMNKITQISSFNQLLKNEVTQTKKKIEWGEQIRVHLKKKLKKLKKNQSHSFTSSVNDDHDGWAPPKADEQQYIAVENLNESIINSILENETENQRQMKRGMKCNCHIF